MLNIKNLLLAASSGFITVFPAVASGNSMIELTYHSSHIQCGPNSPQLVINVDVYHNGTLVAGDLAVGESVLIPDLTGLSMNYKKVNGGCSLVAPTEKHLTKNDPIPNIPGAYDQDSIVTLLSGLNQYEDLYLVELGTNNPNSFAYDLQDVIFIVDNNPGLSPNNNFGSMSPD